LNAASELSAGVGVVAACIALGVSRATFYRRRQPPVFGPKPKRRDPRALSDDERAQVLETLNSESYQNLAPAEVYAGLLDQGEYLCSIRTMYRILDANKQVRERRDQLRHPSYTKPELLATGPKQLWSWDITKLKGPEKWCYFHLYVIIDVFSRYVVGWMVAEKESAVLAKRFLAETIGKELDDASDLTVHADRGTSMRSKMVAHLLADLGITKTHSRPYTSNDNPYSEAQFKTMKYRPSFPGSFGSLEDAKAFCRPFFQWYNREHHHHGLALLTPSDVHFGRANDVLDARQQTLDKAYTAHPERFSNPPMVPRLSREVWINPPSPKAAEGASEECEDCSEDAPGSDHVDTAGAPAAAIPSINTTPGSEDMQLATCQGFTRVTNFSLSVSQLC